MKRYCQRPKNRLLSGAPDPVDPMSARLSVLALLGAAVLGVAGTGLIILGIFVSLLGLWWGLPAIVSGTCATIAAAWLSGRVGSLAGLPRAIVGLTSFALDIISLAAVVVAAFAYAHYARDRNYDGDFLGTDFLVFLVANLVSLSTAIPGLALGIMGLRREERRRLWPILGTSMALVILAAWVWCWLSLFHIT